MEIVCLPSGEWFRRSCTQGDCSITVTGPTIFVVAERLACLALCARQIGVVDRGSGV